MKMEQIEVDLIGKFGEYPLDALDKFVLQTHLNALAERYCQDRVKQARSYLKSIFDEAIEQEYLAKDPTRKPKTPKNLRPKDKRVLSWEQLWSILEIASRRDRLLLALDMTEALRPSELFALRWRSFDDGDTLSITVYRRKLRPFGKTPGSLTKVHLPEDSPTNSGYGRSRVGTYRPMTLSPQTQTAAFWMPPTTGSECSSLWPKRAVELSDPTSDHGDPGAEHGVGQGHPVASAAFAARYHGQRIHAGAAGERPGDGRFGIPNADEGRGGKQCFVDLPQNAPNFSGADTVSC
jgi:hypothetical protein